MGARDDGLHRPRRLTPTVREVVLAAATAKPPEPREKLAERLIGEIEKKGEKPPTLETLKRYISRFRQERDPLDQPWTLAACAAYPTQFPPSSLRTLTRLVSEDLRQKDILLDGSIQPRVVTTISIRKAMWIARLEPLVEQFIKPSRKRNASAILLGVSEAYQMAQRISEDMGEKVFDSKDLDEALFNGNLDHVRFHGIAKDTVSICKDNCDSCKWEPILKGQLCQPKGTYQAAQRFEEDLQKAWMSQSRQRGELK